MPKPKKVDQSPGVIAFRLDPESEQILAERAAALGVSRNILARRYLIEVLEASEERTALREAVNAANGNLTRFYNSFIFAVEALLVSAGKVKEEEARAWIDEHFK
jgi:hypothetical protein